MKPIIYSDIYSQYNGKEELAVKTAERILNDNTYPYASLDHDETARAILEYHNLPI